MLSVTQCIRFRGVKIALLFLLLSHNILKSYRKSKVWNEPVYNKRETIPSNLQPSQLSQNSKEPFNLHVQVSSKLFNDPMRMYPMHYSVKGYALIINNQEFDDPDVYPYRKGAEVDGANMKRLFIQLGFNVMSYTNMTRNATLKKLIEFSEIAGSNESEMMVVCMLSHGMESDKIISADGFEIDIETDVLRQYIYDVTSMSPHNKDWYE